MTSQRRFVLLQRGGFVCAFCGAAPGNDRLQIAHIYPHSLGGTEHDNNLVVACDRCNNGMGTLASIPRSMLTGERDADGWLVWKRWGAWVLSFRPEVGGASSGDFMVDPSPCQIAIVYAPIVKRTHSGGYYVMIDRVHEDDWERHVARKAWLSREELSDFSRALEFARTLVRKGERA